MTAQRGENEVKMASNETCGSAAFGVIDKLSMGY